MRFKSFFALLAPVFIAAPLPALAAASTAPAGGRPNIVYLLADQLRYESVGYAGDSKARTPNIDRLAGQGISFRNMVSNTPVCAPYRASLFTGKYTSSTGMVINELRVNPNHRCLAHVLTEAGYATGYVGKWHLWSNVAGEHDKPEYHYIPPEMRRYRLGFDGLWAAFNFHHEYYKAFYFGDTPERIEVKGYEPDVQTDLAIEFIRKNSGTGRPFALFLSYGTPHDPWSRRNVPPEWLKQFEDIEFTLPQTWSDTPDPYMDRFTDPKPWLNVWKKRLPDMQRVYYAMTANLDWNIGRVLEALSAAGLADNTILVFTSDHGEMFGQHGRVAKLTFYEASVRVPFLIRWPGKVPAGAVNDACAGTVDIMPTLLGLTGLPIPREVEGMDLAHLALGRSGPEPEAAFLQGMGHTYLWKDGFEWRAIRDKRYTYAIYRRDRSELLFDNLADPLQTRNLVKDASADPAHAAALSRLRGQLKRKMESLNDTFEACSWYRDHWTKNRCILRGARDTAGQE